MYLSTHLSSTCFSKTGPYWGPGAYSRQHREKDLGWEASPSQTIYTIIYKTEFQYDCLYLYCRSKLEEQEEFLITQEEHANSTHPECVWEVDPNPGGITQQCCLLSHHSTFLQPYKTSMNTNINTYHHTRTDKWQTGRGTFHSEKALFLHSLQSAYSTPARVLRNLLSKLCFNLIFLALLLTLSVQQCTI